MLLFTLYLFFTVFAAAAACHANECHSLVRCSSIDKVVCSTSLHVVCDWAACYVFIDDFAISYFLICL